MAAEYLKPIEELKIITCHLAMVQVFVLLMVVKQLYCTVFTPLDGLMMVTRAEYRSGCYYVFTGKENLNPVEMVNFLNKVRCAGCIRR